jgi:hypothetical protein
MEKVVAGLFDGPDAAGRAMRELEHAGFERRRMVLLNADTAGEHARRTANETAGVLAGTAGGAGIAGVAGLLLGLATSADTHEEAISVLSGFDIPSQDVHCFTEAIRNGNSVLIVPALDAEAAEAQNVLDRFGALDLDSNCGKPGSHRLESAFRRDYSSRFEQSGYTYRQLAPAYRYGHELAEDDLYRGKEWIVVESSAYRQWEHDNPNTWEQVKEAVKQGFLHN